MRRRRIKRKVTPAPLLKGVSQVLAWAGSYWLLAKGLHGAGVPEAGFWAGGISALATPVVASFLPGHETGFLAGRIIRRFSAEARECDDPKDLHGVIVDALDRLCRPQSIHLWLPPAGEPAFHRVAGKGKAPNPVIPEFTLRQWAKERSALWTKSDAWMEENGVSLVLPISLQGHLVGIITLGKPRSGHGYRASTLRAIASFGAQVALAIAPYQLRAEQQLQLSKLEAVSRLYVDAQRRAVTDGLTGLITHLHFKEQLAKRFSEAKRYDHPVSLMLIDIDHFKRINDSFGHQVGDEVLRAVAEAVTDSVRTCDTVARYGGEELAVILPQTANEGAFALAERVRRAIESLDLRDLSGRRKVQVTASVGIAEAIPDDRGPADLITRADRALYEAKNRGRNRVIRSA